MQYFESSAKCGDDGEAGSTLREGDVDSASSDVGDGRMNAVDEGDTGNTVADGDTGSAALNGYAGDETPSQHSAERESFRKCSASGDAGNTVFSGKHGAKVALAGDVGRLVYGLVRAVSRDAVHEKLENVGDGYAESRSSWKGERRDSSSSCSFTLSEEESMRRKRIESERLRSERSSL